MRRGPRPRPARSLRRGATALVLALVLAGCSEIDTGTPQPSLGGGSPAPAGDPADPELVEAVRDAGLRECADLPRRDAPAPEDGLPSLELACLGSDETVDLATLDGPLVINLWASWCGPCREELPLLARLDEELGERVTVVGIDTQDGDPLAAVELAAGSDLAYPQLADPDATTRGPLRVVGLPQTVFVDGQGKMVATERVPFTSYDDLTAAVRRHLEVAP